jgi:serine protease DegQ
VTLDGKVVGINGRIATRYMNRVNSGVGYAIPSNQIKNFLPGMMKSAPGGAIFHGMVGGLAVESRNTMGQGARVQAVRPATTAEKAGLRTGDLIVGVNGTRVFNRERYLAAVGNWPQGAEVSLRVERDGEARDVKLILDKFSPMEGFGLSMPERPAPVRPKGSAYLGVYVEETKDGLKVGDVTPDSPADAAGLRKGDLLLKISNRKLTDRNELNSRVWRLRPGSRVIFTVLREGMETSVEVVLGPHPDDS